MKATKLCLWVGGERKQFDRLTILRLSGLVEDVESRSHPSKYLAHSFEKHKTIGSQMWLEKYMHDCFRVLFVFYWELDKNIYSPGTRKLSFLSCPTKAVRNELLDRIRVRCYYV